MLVHTHESKEVEVPYVLVDPENPVDEQLCTVSIVPGSVSVDEGMCYPVPADGCEWQQSEFTKVYVCDDRRNFGKCTQGHWEDGVPADRREWGIHCCDKVPLDEAFDVECEEGALNITEAEFNVLCPPGSVETRTVIVPFEYELMATEKVVGDTVHFYGNIFTKSARSITYRFLVQKRWPNLVPKLLMKTDKVTGIVDGVLKTNEYEYTFDRPGIHIFRLRIWKPDGRIGEIRQKVVVRDAPAQE